MSYRWKTRAQGSIHLVRQSTAHGSGSSRHVDIDTQDVAILTMQPNPYRPVLLSYQTVVPNPYNREGITHMGFMGHTPTYDNADIEQLYSHNEAYVGDSETHGQDDLHGGTSAMDGEQSEDPASKVLGPKEFWTISKYIC
jgi:hypothetical protein